MLACTFYSYVRHIQQCLNGKYRFQLERIKHFHLHLVVHKTQIIFLLFSKLNVSEWPNWSWVPDSRYFFLALCVLCCYCSGIQSKAWVQIPLLICTFQNYFHTLRLDDKIVLTNVFFYSFIEKLHQHDRISMFQYQDSRTKGNTKKLFRVGTSDPIHKIWINTVIAPSEVRTHDLEIMRLARCLLRYRGLRNQLLCHIIIVPQISITLQGSRFFGQNP